MHEVDGGTAQERVPPPPSSKQQATTVADDLTPLAPNLHGHNPAPVSSGLPQRPDTPVLFGVEVGGVLVAGFLGNIVLRTGSVASLASTLLVIVMALTLVASGRVRRRDPLLFLLLAVALSPWLTIRSNAPVTAVTISMIFVLVCVACGLSLRGSAFDSRLRYLVGHIISPTYEWLYGMGILRRFTVESTADRRLAPLLRGLLFAIPVLIVFASLLAAADDVFASFLLLGELPSVVGHVLLTAAVAVMLLGFVSRAAHQTEAVGAGQDLRRLGTLEVAIILGSLATLFAAFVTTQAVVALGGADHVLETEGLTQAEHARSGFFQLLWVAGLAGSLVGGIGAIRVTNPEKGKDRFVPLALATLALTLVIAMISVRRLARYVDIFGLTPLRFWALAGTFGIVLLVIAYAISVSGWRKELSWFPGIAVVLSALFVLGLNVANPDDRVAAHNMDRSQAPIDVQTLSSLSDDAVATIIELRGELTAEEDALLLRQLCLRPDRHTEFGLLEYNRGEVSADATLDQACALRPVATDLHNAD